jgi:hypothetical protein
MPWAMAAVLGVGGPAVRPVSFLFPSLLFGAYIKIKFFRHHLTARFFYILSFELSDSTPAMIVSLLQMGGVSMPQTIPDCTVS